MELLSSFIDIPRGCGAGLGPWLLTAICCRSLLLLLGHKEAQCRAEETEWSSQAAWASQSSQTARRPQLTFPPSNGLRSPGRAPGQVRKTRASWQTEGGKNGGRYCSFSQPAALFLNLILVWTENCHIIKYQLHLCYFSLVIALCLLMMALVTAASKVLEITKIRLGVWIFH